MQVLHTYELTPSREAKSVQSWLSVDPLWEKYPSMSPYMYCAGNPIVLKDPDGRTIVPTNKEGDIAVNTYLSKFKKVEDKAFNIKRDFINGCPVYSSKDIKAKNPEDFLKALGKIGDKMTESEKEEAYSFYLGLQDPTEYQVEAWLPRVTDSYTTGEVVIKEGSVTQKSTKYIDRVNLEHNDVFMADFGKIGDFGALFNSNRKSEGGNIFGKGFNYYKNYDRTEIKIPIGLILINGSQNNYGNCLGKAFKSIILGY